jgi:murein DD-endopeptidase MepM/ murein hydrolase activator NlpD
VIFFLFSWVAQFAGAQTKSAAAAPPHSVKKVCDGGVVLKINAATAAQGSLLPVIVTGVQPDQAVTAEWDGHGMPVWREWLHAPTLHSLLAVDLEKAAGTYDWKLSWTGPDGKTIACTQTITVRTGKFPTEHLKVEEQYVHPDPEQEKRAAEDQKKMKVIYDTVTPEALWKGKFLLPLKGDFTGKNFGRRRVLNGETRSPHTGVDYPAPSGTPVYASQAGKVVVAENLYYSGNTVVIDHGLGIYTLYAHLSEIGVHDGDTVVAAQEIGKVGATGRVTGPHLHWGLTVDHARVDARQIVTQQP